MSSAAEIALAAENALVAKTELWLANFCDYYKPASIVLASSQQEEDASYRQERDRMDKVHKQDLLALEKTRERRLHQLKQTEASRKNM